MPTKPNPCVEQSSNLDNTGIVADYPMYEGTGSQIDDISPSLATPGLFSGGVSWTTGQYGPCLALDGTTGYVPLATPAGLPSGSAARTMAIWFKLATNQDSVLANYGGNGANATRFGLFYSATGGTIGFEGINVAAQFTWAHDTNWHRLIAVVPSGATLVNQILVYFDGVQKTVTYTGGSTTIATIATDPVLGTLSGAHGLDLWGGNLDLFAIWSVAFTPSQISTDYAYPLARFTGQTASIAPGYTFAPPGLKVPWQRFPVAGPIANQKPAAPVINTADSYMPGFTTVPRGFNPGPWPRAIDPLLALQQKAPVPPPPPTLVAPGYTFTPPGMFAPYGQLVHPVTPLPQIAPPVVVPPQIMPGYTQMPPGLGGPWRSVAVAQASSPPGNTPIPPPTPHPAYPSHNLPFLPRLPQEDEERRLKRITEKLSILYNSLFGQGFLVQTSPSNFTMRSGGFVMSRPPTVTDDLSIGVNPGCSWVDTTGQKVYFCVSNAVGSAVWRGPF